MNYIDETELRKAITCIKPNNELFEIRIISSRYRQPVSGYFKSIDKAVECLKKQDLKDSNVYIVLNGINEACYSRKQKDCFLQEKTTTSDTDITVREWIMVDFDPKRPTGTSTTKEQIAKAKQKMIEARMFLVDQGLSKPIVAFSGNGYHLLFKIKMKNSEETRDLLKKFLEALDELFSDEEVVVDRVNFNAARVCKLYGTLAQKGLNTEDRPHRMSRIIQIPDEIKPVDIEYIKKICGLVKKEPVMPNKYNGYNAGNFDLTAWLAKYGIHYTATSYGGGTKFILDKCPFDENHTGKDAAIFQSTNGAIGFHCFHNSCSDKQWRDVRLLYEPDAYTEKWHEEEKRSYRTFNREQVVPKIAVDTDLPMFMTPMEIIRIPRKQESFIKTGIDEIDKRMRGLKKDHVSVWSGLRSSAKSTLLSQICLNAVNDGNNVLIYSGEMKNTYIMDWMMLQAAGKSNVEPAMWPGIYNVPKEIKQKIAEWIGDRLVVYTNDYGNNYQIFQENMLKEIDKRKVDFVFLDNLMAFNIDSLGETIWAAQKQFVWSLHEIARTKDIHIAFVAHPRKATGFLRFDDISGTADLGNMVDDAFIVHRNNDDFKRLFSAMYKKRDDVLENGTNIVEIVKDRDHGTQDVFIPLYFEQETKRLKNSFTENKIYKWADKDDDGWKKQDDEDNPFT